ncbi:LacI family DNA-binding transcriptional regulator [Tessaracoccus caeni]|uniref:LacI family DNA-binding transcriptional regulator n=1 Tax=Tessaracoccus caeni TaxID=3031239 RepID=UPI0023DA0BD4|nr:LacI family DNA-binding transcriptional regulator [Tessaracoccus caeni]MDF1488054.1 LacI family DNA-binding transcriptional regulator [Tessaracoccus caeni]
MAKNPAHRSSRPTIYDVAREAGVSKSLVSLVLNDSPLVSEAKRAAVKEAIARLGYRPSWAAAMLATSRSRMVGLVIDDFENPWFVALLNGVREVMGPQGFQVAVREHYQLGDRTMNAIEGFLDTQVDALLIAGEPRHTFASPGIPTVLQGNRLHGIEGVDRVLADEALGVRLIMTHLRQRGHTAIGHVTGVGGSAKARLDAYIESMTEAGEQPRYAGEENETNEEGGYLGTLELLDQHPLVTAVFAANDTMALGARAALRERGREVPADVALAGYDDSLLAQARFLDLTTIDARGYDVGRACGQVLLRRLENPDKEPETIVIPTKLVVRSSTSGQPHR